MPFYGKFRGKVGDVDDPYKRGRIRAEVPGVLDGQLPWAEPCTPYAGPKVGFYAIPPVGANVWIEFEEGNPERPIWAGCFWGSLAADGVPAEATGPDVKVLRTPKMLLALDETAGSVTLKVTPENSPASSLVMNNDGIVLKCDNVTVTVTQAHIELKKTPASIEVADDITLKKAAASVVIANDIDIKNGGASAKVGAAQLDLKNGASTVTMSVASVSVNNGALEVM
jgi:hypothetical protein